MVVVGAGHNGLTAAAYLARAGRSVLVLERRAQVGGACTLERPFPDERWLVSPCAYVVEVRQIAVLYLSKLRKQMEFQGKEVEVTERAIDLLTEKGFSPAYGARFRASPGRMPAELS